MYAVIETGGKQYRVEVGSEIEVERLAGDPGSEVVLDRVLLVADEAEASVGRPLVEDARVTASVVRQARGDKIIVFKYRPKARRRVKKGHRQELTVLRVADIVHLGRSAAAEATRVEEAAKTERQRLEEAAAAQAVRDAALAERLAKKAAQAKAEANAAQAKAEAKAAQAMAEAKPARGTAKPKASEAKPVRGKARAQSGESAPPTDEPKKRGTRAKKDE
ncbi:MAG: 50S ribosomal protein L21 [Chloroflexi bacterium GWC2_73_18]|nr:MAG: 50S ribosomal protein L21 [Chloroflexi bacterium GWC2_73_18]